MQIKLHIGVHKTATTHLQSILESKKTNIHDNARLHIATPENFRQQWLPRFLKYTHTKELHDKHKLLEIAPHKGTWLISEENFSGVPYDFIKTNGIYPYLQQRLHLFTDLFTPADIRVFISIRSYETFYRSIYLEIIRNNGYIPFSSYYKDAEFKQYSWKTVIESLLHCLPQNKITFWQYEEYTTVLPTLMHKLTGETLDKECTHLVNKKLRVSLSCKALQELESYAKNNSQIASKEMVEYFYNKYPANETNGFFEPFDTATVEYYQQKYQHDIDEIIRLYPQINYITGKADDR